ncbi:MAG TPA: 4'-phosphopantetheinyl transferase superfamily protein [Terriglobia bacterium]|nr:4'-phosphopantetheinyl transferase superfamily protein [Terriglobia bacterium]
MLYLQAKVIPLSFSQLRDSLYNSHLACERGIVDVWLLSARLDANDRASCGAVLSFDERERARKFRFSIDQDRFIVGRAGLRQVLSQYCAQDPAMLLFQSGSHGKPLLVQQSLKVKFNVSHAGAYVLIGIAEDVECGVDIEQPHARISEQQIATRFFCPREVEWMGRAELGFARLWTMKEAVMKAVGWGLTIPLNAIDVVDVAEGRTSRLLVEATGQEPLTLWVQELNLLEGYATSVAAVGSDHAIRIHAGP